MSNGDDFTRDLLRRHSAGRKLRKAQLEELTRDGYLKAIDTTTYALTDVGAQLLKGQKP